MGKTLYLECNAGISGDMSVASLLSLGADTNVLQEAIDSIPVEGFHIEISDVVKSGIVCKDFNVVLDEDNHDHDMEYLHAHTHEHAHHHDHEHHHHDHEHHHDHGHHHHHHSHTHGHAHTHRNLHDVKHILEHVHMSDHAKDLANRIFDIIAEAEAKAHGLPIDEVHFHEVGAIDSIVDIVAFSVCFDNLGIDEVIVPKLCEGKGTIRCQHGILPIPVPATSNIMSAYDLNVEFMDIEGEFVTPTGAAIVAAIKTSDTLENTYKIKQIGLGAGKRNYARASILRAMIIETSSKKDTIMKLETNIDDCTPEVLGYVMDLLFEQGARDVHYTPVFMKKNRPAYLLSVICDKENVDVMESVIFSETTTIGIRKMEMERTVLERTFEDKDTPYGVIKFKVCKHQDKVYYYPEYESVKDIAKANKVPFQKVYNDIMKIIK